jgi:hypothetical protein
VYELAYDCPSIQNRQQGSFGIDASMFNQNRSVVVAQGDRRSGCGAVASGFYANQIVVISAGATSVCSKGERLQYVASRGASGILVWSSFMDPFDASTGSDYVHAYEAGVTIPVFFCSSMNIYVPFNFSYQYTNSADFIYFALLSGANLTGFDKGFSPNPFLVDLNTFGSGTQVTFVACFFAVAFLLIVSSVKLVQFLHFQGFQLALPQIVCALAFLQASVSFFIVQCGMWNWRGVYVRQVFNVFEFWPMSFCFTACLVVGLYFGEVAHLTSAQKVVGLSAYKWPAIALVGVCWALIITAGALLATPLSFSTGSGNLGSVFAQAFGITGLGIPLLVVCWGGVVLFIGIRFSNADVLRIIVAAFFAVSLNFAFGTAYLILWFNPNFPRDNEFSMWGYVIFFEYCLTFIPSISTLLVLLCFRISVSKEIEISKSGTSSTSSGTQSHSSKSSSSSSTDPVIEL